MLASVTLTAHLEISKGIGLTKCPRKHNLFHSLKHPKPQHAGSSLNREQPSCFPTPVPTHRPHPSIWCGSAQSMPLAMPQGLALAGEMTAHLEISKGIGLTKCPRKHNLFHSLKHPKPQHAGSSLNREQPSCFPTPVPTHRPHPSIWCGSAQSMPLAMPQGLALAGEMTAPCCCSQANA